MPWLCVSTPPPGPAIDGGPQPALALGKAFPITSTRPQQLPSAGWILLAFVFKCFQLRSPRVPARSRSPSTAFPASSARSAGTLPAHPPPSPASPHLHLDAAPGRSSWRRAASFPGGRMEMEPSRFGRHGLFELLLLQVESVVLPPHCAARLGLFLLFLPFQFSSSLCRQWASEAAKRGYVWGYQRGQLQGSCSSLTAGSHGALVVPEFGHRLSCVLVG